MQVVISFFLFIGTNVALDDRPGASAEAGRLADVERKPSVATSLGNNYL